MDFLLSLSLAKYEAYFLGINAILLVLYTITVIIEKGIILFHIAFGKSPIIMDDIHPVHEEVPTLPKTTSSHHEKNTEKKTLESSDVKEEVSEQSTEEQAISSEELSPESKQNLAEIIKIVKTKIARGEFSDARSKIVEGLTIDKFDKELNCQLASLYERDQDYRRAELVYKDLVIVHETDPELYTKLGFALSMQGKYEIAYEIYKKLLSLDKGSADEANEMLANLASELGRFEDVKTFAKAYLKNHPRNSDILSLLASAHSTLGEKPAALEVLEKLRVIEPYNAKIRDLADKIRLEIELSQSFRWDETIASNPEKLYESESVKSPADTSEKEASSQ